MEPDPASTPVRQGFDLKPAGSQARAAREALRAIGRVHGVIGLPSMPIPVREANEPGVLGWFDHDRSTGAAREIVISFARTDAWPALTIVHEIGHYLDHVALSGSPTRLRNRETIKQSTPEMRALMAAIRVRIFAETWRPKQANPRELWARAYAQWIAWRSGSSRLQGQLDRILTHQNATVRIRHWPYDEFAPIASAIDGLMEARGWARQKAPQAL